MVSSPPASRVLFASLSLTVVQGEQEIHLERRHGRRILLPDRARLLAPPRVWSGVLPHMGM